MKIALVSLACLAALICLANYVHERRAQAARFWGGAGLASFAAMLILGVVLP